MFRVLLLGFLLIPLIEIYFLIQVGEMIGAGWTILAIVATAVIGVNLLRAQGAATLLRAQANMRQGSLPAMEMMEGIVLAASGMLLLTPGFFTDFFGFILLVPFCRQSLIRSIGGKFTVHSQARYTHQANHDSTIIEGEIVDNKEDRHLK
ncbi:MAG: exlusion protein FxsA [Alphaproteobacteria bacterium]|nr:MAG: exlusion protein FxsA [Alphaproteobacteria bacterium]